jgi:hypothetical protein
VRKGTEITEAMKAKKLSEKFVRKLEKDKQDIRWFHYHFKLEKEGFLTYPETVSQVNGTIEMSANLVRAINRYLEA